MRIAFIHPGRAILPGLEAYQQFFPRYGFETTVSTAGSGVIAEADVEWHFMGTGGKKNSASTLLVHEYASASIPPLAGVKDRIKQLLNVKPDFRIFLNEFVRQRLGFKDDVPFGYRDVGIHGVQNSESTAKQFDFILPGGLVPYSFTQTLFKKFAHGPLCGKSLLVVSPDSRRFGKHYAGVANICFKEQLPHAEMMELVNASRYGLNIRPKVAPFSFQTSSKVLDYCAARVPVVTTDSFWLRDFTHTYGGRFFILKNDFSNLDPDLLESFPFEFPEMDNLGWEKKIRGSGILEFFERKGLITL